MTSFIQRWCALSKGEEKESDEDGGLHQDNVNGAEDGEEATNSHNWSRIVFVPV